MESKEKKIGFLANLFQHLDGIVLIPTIIELHKKNILKYISKKKRCSLSDISNKHNANEAYLNVALRLLCSQGILKQEFIDNEIYFHDTSIKRLSEKLLSTYQIVDPIYQNKINCKSIINDVEGQISDQNLFRTITNYNTYKKTQNTKKRKKNTYDIHVEGCVLGPIIILLSRHGYVEKIIENQKIVLNINNQWKKEILNMFFYSNICDGNYCLTEYGQFLLKRATSYGVTVSYMPTYRNIHNLLYGNPTVLWSSTEEEEKHVDRSMNVWGSGGAHKTYFKKIDKIIIDLFNLPLEKQPKGFIDIGCGNGKLIEHIFDLIYYKTIRGKHLKKNPLFIVGSDFNYKALEATKDTINKADIWAKTAFGDISEPTQLAKKLKKKYNIDLCDLLNMRSFLDHNRIYTTPKFKNTTQIQSTGAFCHKGKRLHNNDVQQNLKEHFEKWYPYLSKYGLLIVELHTIDPNVASRNIGKTAITAYDASHGFSDQYIIEYNIFLKIILEVGLQPDPLHEYTFPNKEIPIVSINRLIPKLI